VREGERSYDGASKNDVEETVSYAFVHGRGFREASFEWIRGEVGAPTLAEPYAIGDRVWVLVDPDTGKHVRWDRLRASGAHGLVVAKPLESANRRCAYCHDGLGGLPADVLSECGLCHAVFHRECFAEMGTCITLGCENRRERSSEVRNPSDP
jgi:hypothetical protein